MHTAMDRTTTDWLPTYLGTTIAIEMSNVESHLHLSSTSLPHCGRMIRI